MTSGLNNCCQSIIAVTVVCFTSYGFPSIGHCDKQAGISFGHKLILEDPDGGSDSSVSPDGKWLAYSSRRSGNLDIWLAEIDTGKTRQLTTHPATDNEPRWHPDGTHLVFVTQRSGSQDVYVLEIATRRLTPIATQPVNEDYPSFSRDGSEICFTGGPQGSREVQIHNVKSGKARTLTRGFGYIGATNFSPDGKRLVFHAYYDNSYSSGKSDLFVISTSGGKVVNITNERDTWDYKPNWSFDGKWITFSSKRASPNFNLWLIRPDGSDRQPLTNVKGPDLRWSNWTRDGRIGWHRIDQQNGKLRVVEVASGKVSDVYHSDTHVRDLSSSPKVDSLLFECAGQVFVFPSSGSEKPRELASGLAPRWRGDGESVTFLQNRRSQVGVVNINGGNVKTINVAPKHWSAASSNPWSPDKKQIAIATFNEGKNQLLLASSDGSQSKVLVDGGEAKSSPVWGHDGTHIFFVENRLRSLGYYISTEPVYPVAKQRDIKNEKADPKSAAVGAARAADFQLSDLHGDRRALSDLKGKVTLLYFWSTLRECKADLQLLQQLRDDYAKKGVSVIGLACNSGTRTDVETFLNSTNVSFPTLMCSQDVCSDYRVATYPTTFLIDGRRQIHYWMYGILVADHWEKRINQLLSK